MFAGQRTCFRLPVKAHNSKGYACRCSSYPSCRNTRGTARSWRMPGTDVPRQSTFSRRCRRQARLEEGKGTDSLRVPSLGSVCTGKHSITNRTASVTARKHDSTNLNLQPHAPNYPQGSYSTSQMHPSPAHLCRHAVLPSVGMGCCSVRHEALRWRFLREANIPTLNTTLLPAPRTSVQHRAVAPVRTCTRCRRGSRSRRGGTWRGGAAQAARHPRAARGARV